MSSEECRTILNMVESGKITADEAVVLMRALNEPADDEGFETPLPNEIVVSIFD